MECLPCADECAHRGDDACGARHVEPTIKRISRTTDRFNPCTEHGGVFGASAHSMPESACELETEQVVEPPSTLSPTERMNAARAAKKKAKTMSVDKINAARADAGTALDGLAKVEAEPHSYAHLWPSKASANRYVKESVRRPVYQARVFMRDSQRAEATAMASDSVAVASLTIDSSEFKSSLYLDTLEQRLVAAGAERTTILGRPHDRLQRARTAAFVQLLDRAAGGWRADEERSKVWIEYLSTEDFDQGVDKVSEGPRRASSTLTTESAVGGPWFGQALAIAYEEMACHAKSFHTRGVKVAKKTMDKFHADAVSIEFGYSTFPGGSALQMHAWRNGIAYERKATAAGRSMALGRLVEMAAPVAWDFVVRRYGAISREMLREVGVYGIYGTGFSKVTIAYDNPTCVHYDSNYGADVILAFRLRSLKGGEHVMLSVDGCDAIVVETSELGVLIGGCHEHLLHGNLGTTDGGRVVLAWYLPEALLSGAPNRFG